MKKTGCGRCEVVVEIQGTRKIFTALKRDLGHWKELCSGSKRRRIDEDDEIQGRVDWILYLKFLDLDDTYKSRVNSIANPIKSLVSDDANKCHLEINYYNPIHS